MFSLDDERWTGLKGGYRLPFDARPSLALLATGKDNRSVWETLWDNLHHQGDVGEASYATVPHLVRIYKGLGIFDWNIFGIIACIELCRQQPGNPPLSDWLEEDYLNAIQDLAKTGIAQFDALKNPEDVRVVLSILALSKGERLHGKFLLNYSDDELSEMESRL